MSPLPRRFAPPKAPSIVPPVCARCRFSRLRWALLCVLVLCCGSTSGCTSMLLDKKLDVSNIMGPIGRKARKAAEVAERDPLAPREGSEEFDKAKELYDRKEYAQARKAFSKIAKKYKDKPVEEEALFMVAESYYQLQYFAKAQDAYDELLKKHPNSLYLEQTTRRLFDIAKYWLGNPKPASEVELAHFTRVGPEERLTDNPDASVPFAFPLKPNLLDDSRPLFDTQGNALKALTSVWIHDIQGPLAGDAMMMAATYHLRKGNYQEADHLFASIREMHSQTKHAPAAYVLGQHASYSSYQGARYDGKQLEEARKLTDSALRLYPDLPQKRKLQSDLARIKGEAAERDWVRVQFHMKRGEKDAAAVYSEFILRDWPNSPRAADARALLLELGPEYAQGILPTPLHKPPATPVENYDSAERGKSGDDKRTASKPREPGRVRVSDDVKPIPEEE